MPDVWDRAVAGRKMMAMPEVQYIVFDERYGHDPDRASLITVENSLEAAQEELRDTFGVPGWIQKVTLSNGMGINDGEAVYYNPLEKS